jgi:hypothetical protein
LELSAVQNQQLRRQLVFGACGLMVIAAAATFFAGDHTAAAIIAGQAWITCFITYAATKRGRL